MLLKTSAEGIRGPKVSSYTCNLYYLLVTYTLLQSSGVLQSVVYLMQASGVISTAFYIFEYCLNFGGPGGSLVLGIYGEEGWGTGCSSMLKLVGRTIGPAQYRRFVAELDSVCRWRSQSGVCNETLIEQYRTQK